MTTLIVSPDYVSHYNPLSVLARAAAGAGGRVVVATGPGLQARVEAEGHGWRHLPLGPASNSGVAGDDPAIREFLAATVAGPLATIRHQAEKRERDLLWQPERIATEMAAIIDRLDPDHIVVDHVSFAATLGAYATGRPFTTLVPGHPSQLPVGSERYGVPRTWPSAMGHDEEQLTDLHRLADRVTDAFTERWNRALAASGSARPPVDDAFRVHGDRVLYNSIAELTDPDRVALLPPNSRFVGPLVRRQALDDEFASWQVPGQAIGGVTERGKATDRPQVYVGFGTFLSHRGDVLAAVAEGLRSVGARAAIAAGPTPRAALGPIPDDWFVAPILPQVALLPSADLVIHHGGNNSVQESLAAGGRQLVMPFSTDQFANAADLERIGLAKVVAPNTAGPSEIQLAVADALAAPPGPPVPPLSDEALARRLFGADEAPIAAGGVADGVAVSGRGADDPDAEIRPGAGTAASR